MRNEINKEASAGKTAGGGQQGGTMEQQGKRIPCNGLDKDARGIIRWNGSIYTVAGLLPGEKGEVSFIRRRGVTDTKLLSVEGRSSQRAAVRCPVFGICGGCQLLHMNYPAQLAWKHQQVDNLLGNYAQVRPVLGMEKPEGYRNKVHSTFTMDRRGQIRSGVYEENSHRVVPVERCLIQDPAADAILADIRKLMQSCRILPYNEDTGYGLLRHVLIRRGFATGQVMVVLVTASHVFPSRNNFVNALRKKHPEITTIVMNINDRRTSMVLGDRERVLYGKGYIEDTLCGYTFRISPKSFYQVNPVQTQVLYNKALELAKLTGKERVLDAYCGIGTISLVASRQAGEVIGVELNRDAVRDAIANAKRNGVRNVTFLCGDAGEYLDQLVQEGERMDVVIMDPPRSGSDETFLSSLCRMAPQKVVYISCNPETQARDLEYLCKRGYRVEEIQPVDMFPQTLHVECVVLMSRIQA